MRFVLIAYVIIINAVGFLLMGWDKLKARRKKWRIPEKHLFGTALIGGSVGVLAGMYLFRHKTKHKTFVFGIPCILFIQVLLILLVFTWNQKRMDSPMRAVEYELDLIQELDDDTIRSYVSYQNLTGAQADPDAYSSEAAEAVRLFFQKFRYRIQDVTTTDNESEVTVLITNIDTRTLARDICTEILTSSFRPELTSEEDFSAGTFYTLLRDALANNDYSLSESEAVFHLKKDETGWVILSDDKLENELVSRFTENINDPYLLDPETVLQIQLDAFRHLTADEWIEFLKIHDLFNTRSEEYLDLIDHAYVRRIAENFSYSILRCELTNNEGIADVRITSLDLKEIFQKYKEDLLEYAADPRSIRDDNSTVSTEAARMLLEAITGSTGSIEKEVTIRIVNDGTSWNVLFDSDFTNALIGDAEQAITLFQS